jgi:hypothetical protein
MSICEIPRLSETAERYGAALRAVVDLLWEVLGPVGLAGVGGALVVILVEWVRWLAG